MAVNWRYETPGSARAYGYHFNTKTCTGNNPTRTYDAVFLQCKCPRNTVSGDIIEDSVSYTDITSDQHSNKKMFVHYKNSTKGKNACKNGPYNHYVNIVCSHYAAEANPTYSWHGYMFYSGTGTFTLFDPTSESGKYSWYHLGGQYNDRIGDCANNDANRKKACIKACKAVYNRL